MTRAKAADVARDLTNADYLAAVGKLTDGSYIVMASSPAGPVNASTVANFATTNGVNATVQEATFQ